VVLRVTGCRQRACLSSGSHRQPRWRTFAKHSGDDPNQSAVYSFGDDKHSVLTPTLLRRVDGSPLREAGRLRMWFSATHFEGASGLHTLHEATSTDGIHWSAPSPPLLEDVYSPTVIKDGKTYRMWYTDVAREPWILRHAASRDGRQWQVRSEPVLVIDQKWERTRLFYPCVVKTEGVYLLWYGSYWAQESSKTAIGFAVSTDGLSWQKSPHNPVLKPDPKRPWESHYTTSQSVIRLEDGSWRMWYATRRKPPFVNKYFAIATARWEGP
jgi:sucrose-6-phosphate hydrolase SacC (GH32 family)